MENLKGLQPNKVLSALQVSDSAEWHNSATVLEPDVQKVAEHAATSAPQILVVDDLPELRHLVSSILEKEGYSVTSASEGESALAMIDQLNPDVIITDWMMPGMSGPEFIRRIREKEEWAKIPVVMLTAKGDEASRIEGISAGATAYIGKPFDRMEILSAVRNFLILKKQEKQIAQLNTNLTEKVLKRYLAPELVNQIIKGEFNLDEKVKVEMITVMFCDICGFTSLSEELGPHKISSMLNQFLSEMTEVIFKNGGTIDKFTGDGIMTIFGAPDPSPPQDQVFRAKNCALAMQEKMLELNQKWKLQLDRGVMMRIGIHQGPAIVGNFGGPRRTDYTAIGPTVNIASRVESCSKPGEIYFTAIVRDFLPDDCWVKAGRYQLKGIESEVVLFKLHQPGQVMQMPVRKPA
jgi:class 3 adenylate cyclase/CheY-like chemotaxis protein